MKKILIKIVPVCIFLGLASCDKELDLAPTDILIEKSVFADKETAESALADIYYKLFVASTGSTHIIADASLSYVGLPTNSSYEMYVSDNLTATDVEVASIWQKYYAAINTANVFIDKVPVYAAYNESIQKQHIAEAKFNRAYSYLMLLCYYGNGALTGKMNGLGVPLQLKPYEGFNVEDLIPRSTNEEVYTKIIIDLTEAIQDLPAEYINNLTTRSRATKTSAIALLSRIHLYKRDYQACINTSNQVLSNANYPLEPKLLDLFPLNVAGTTSKFSKEVIFGFPVSSNKGNVQFGIHNIGYYNKYQWVTDAFINSMAVNDKRRTDLIFAGIAQPFYPEAKNAKTTYKFNNPSQRDDIIVIRLGEIILNKAEALAQLNGVNAESVSLLNAIKSRSGIASVSESNFASKEALLTEIYKERFLETAFEGRARFDFIRTNRPLRNPALSEDKKTFPIPQREIDLSKGKLVQNPGY
jgi:hypothetical protein